MGPVLIIDGSHWLYVYALTQEPIYNVDFIDISITYYTLRKIYELILKYQPSEVHVVFDIGRDLKKKKKFEKYKSLRNIKSTIKGRSLDSMVHERIQFSRKLLHQILEPTPIHTYLIPFIEGDTIIAFIAKQHLKNDKLIISNDKDMYQLLDEKTKIVSKSPITKLEETLTHNNLDRVWGSIVGKELLLKKIIEETGNEPISYKCIPYYRAFLGDVSDCIPGVKGVGPAIIGYIIQYQQYTGKIEFTSPDDFFTWINTNLPEMESIHSNLTTLLYNKKKRNLNFAKFKEIINDPNTRNTWQTFFELIDFDYAIGELSSSVYRTLLEELRTKKRYDEEEFLQMIREYDLNSTSSYIKWHTINKILETNGDWSILNKMSGINDIEVLFNSLCNRCALKEG